MKNTISDGLEKIDSVLKNFLDAINIVKIIERCCDGQRASMLEKSGKLTPGDHLFITYGVLTHHGIYSGGGRVIHYKKGGKKGIMEVPIQEFAEDVATRGLISKKIYIREHETRKLSREDSLKRARERIGEAGWNLLSNNCEHFVEWCINDKFGPEKIDAPSLKKTEKSSPNATLNDKFALIVSNEDMTKKLCAILKRVNIFTRTLGGKFFWDNICESAGWKFQQNKLNGQCRIIDPGNVRRAWGAEKDIVRAIDEVYEGFKN